MGSNNASIQDVVTSSQIKHTTILKWNWQIQKDMHYITIKLFLRIYPIKLLRGKINGNLLQISHPKSIVMLIYRASVI